MSSDERRKRNMYGVKTERHGRLSEFSERWNEDIERDSEEIVYSKVKERETDFDKAREKNVEKRERNKTRQKNDASELLDQIINFFSFDILADDAKFAQAQLQENHFKNIDKASELYQDIMNNHQDSFFLSESRKRYRILREE